MQNWHNLQRMRSPKNCSKRKIFHICVFPLHSIQNFAAVLLQNVHVHSKGADEKSKKKWRYKDVYIKFNRSHKIFIHHMSAEQKKAHTQTPQLEWKRKYHRCRIPKKAERKKCQPKWKVNLSNFSQFCDCVCLSASVSVCVYFTNTLTLITFKSEFAGVTLKARLMSYPRDRHV